MSRAILVALLLVSVLSLSPLILISPQQYFTHNVGTQSSPTPSNSSPTSPLRNRPSLSTSAASQNIKWTASEPS